MWNLKKAHNERLCRTGTDLQTLKNLRFPKETVWGGERKQGKKKERKVYVGQQKGKVDSAIITVSSAVIKSKADQVDNMRKRIYVYV